MYTFKIPIPAEDVYLAKHCAILSRMSLADWCRSVIISARRKNTETPIELPASNQQPPAKSLAEMIGYGQECHLLITEVNGQEVVGVYNENHGMLNHEQFAECLGKLEVLYDGLSEEWITEYNAKYKMAIASGEVKTRKGKSKINPYVRRNAILKSLGFNNYADYLKSPLWIQIRTDVLRRDKYLCFCGKRAQFVHHVSYSRRVLEGSDYFSLISICKSCHQLAETDEGKKLSFKNSQRRFKALYTFFCKTNGRRRKE